MKEKTSKFLAWLFTNVVLFILFSVGMVVISVAMYLIVPVAIGIEITLVQAIAIVLLLRLVATLLFDDHTITTKIKVKAVDNE